jgi:DNA-binding LacI/PurR family transcriptional regulator
MTLVAVTLRDVATRAGVSIKTVSNVVRGQPHVTEEMRRRVQAAIDELQYRPNLSARYLRTQQVGVIALVIPDLSNPYFSDIGKEVIRAADELSYAVLLEHTQGKREHERRMIDGLRPHLIDGMILNALELHLADLEKRRDNIPLVLLGERLLNVPYDHIMVNNSELGRAGVHHLLDLGRKRIAVIGAQQLQGGETGFLRLQGYTAALLEAGLPVDPHLIIEVKEYQREDGYKATRQLLARNERPDALFCFNDLMAMGALRALYEEGIQVPEEIAVIGIDDIADGRFGTPTLTTIAFNKKKIAELSVSFLIGRISGERTTPPEQVEVDFTLIPRESTLGRRTTILPGE